MTKRYYEEVRRHYYTTPSSYLELIKLFLDILGKKRQEKISQRERIQNGLQVQYCTRAVYSINAGYFNTAIIISNVGSK